jgi:hypothetical protein
VHMLSDSGALDESQASGCLLTVRRLQSHEEKK